MLSYCWKCRKKHRKQKSKSCKDKYGRLMFLSKRTLCDGEKLKYLKEKEATGLLRSLGKKYI